jgi:hypothetical protein
MSLKEIVQSLDEIEFRICPDVDSPRVAEYITLLSNT